MTGIVSYGVFVPDCRITVEEIWSMWSHPTRPATLKALTGLAKTAVNRWDEDTVVMAVEAAKAALEMAAIDASKIQAIYLGTATNPYASKASGTIVAEALGAGPEIMCADVQFAGKSGTSAMEICTGLVKSGLVQHALSIGSDSLGRHVSPNDVPLEYSASAGAAAFILGKTDVIATLDHMYSYATETPEYFRLDGDRYIKKGHGEGIDRVGYLDHVVTAVRNMMKKSGCQSSDFDYAIFSQPNGRLPLAAGEELGFSKNQTQPGLLATEIGDCGSASSLIGLAAVLDKAKENQKILVASYGFGAGCDVLSFTTTEALPQARERRKQYDSVHDQIRNGLEVDYKTYASMERKLIQEYV